MQEVCGGRGITGRASYYLKRSILKFIALNETLRLCRARLPTLPQGVMEDCLGGLFHHQFIGPKETLAL